MFLHTEEGFDFFLQSKPYFWFDKVVEWLLQIIIFFHYSLLEDFKTVFQRLIYIYGNCTIQICGV